MIDFYIEAIISIALVTLVTVLVILLLFMLADFPYYLRWFIHDMKIRKHNKKVLRLKDDNK